MTVTTEAIRREARRLGFFKLGIAPAGPLPHADRFRSWLARGFSGGMQYLKRQAGKREDPLRILPTARSVLVAAMNYYPGRHPPGAPLSGRVSRYAWGTDYHCVLKRRLEELLAFIRTREPSAEGLVCVDTGPVMEKCWGAQTALGWMGKHTNLITRERGSWFFLGVLLTSLQLEHDRPAEDRCGSCDACMRACPTGAIVSPYVLDARRCIAYLTIELRGPIPIPLRTLVGDRVFGCDACQQACPWNRFAAPTDAFAPWSQGSVDLLELAALGPEAFAARFKDSPIRRARREGLVRNACVALGNRADPGSVPVLGSALQDPSPLVRSHAAWALGRMGTEEARRLLARALAREPDAEAATEIRQALI